MGVHKRKRGDKTYYVVRYDYASGKPREKWFTSKSDAKVYAAEIELQPARPTATLTVRELAVVWFTEHVEPNLQLRTRQDYESTLRAHVTPRLGDLRADLVTALDVQRALADMKREGKTAHAQNKFLRTVKALYKKAQAWGLVAHNPTDGISRIRTQAKRIRIFKPAEVYALANEADLLRDRTLIILAGFSGLRKSELFALEWADITADTIHVTKSADADGTIKPPKSFQAREVDLIKPAREALAEYKLAGDSRRLVFSNGEGNSMHLGNWHQRHWKPIRKRAGFPDARFHWLRHTYASLLIEAGVPPIEVSRQIGHSKVSTTFDIYGHLMDQDKAARVAAVESLAQAR